MNHYWVTGTSSGIGKSLAEELLKYKDNQVVGISRRTPFSKDRYTHLEWDLSDTTQLSEIEFPVIEAPKSLVLVNNAGTLGEVKHLGDQTPESIVQSSVVNAIAPNILTNAFIKAYQSIDCKKIIINISSGAATSPYDGWSGYCSSKAYINMLTRVSHEEQLSQKHPILCYAIAPGVVDTSMQTLIRKGNAQDFSRLDKFKQLNANNQLYSPNKVAEHLVDLIENPNKIPSLISRIELI